MECKGDSLKMEARAVTVLMEPKWNVKNLQSFTHNPRQLVLMEPKWNVKSQVMLYRSFFHLVLMEPKWNVKKSESGIDV